MEEVFYDEIEREILQIFLCNGIANIKVEANIKKNCKDEVTMEAKVSLCEAKKIWRSKREAFIAYTHPFGQELIQRHV